MVARNDLTGRRFGRLVVLHYSRTVRGVAFWQCQCDCGNLHVTRGGLLTGKRNHSRSCGCLGKENLMKALTKHGHALFGNHSREYKSWTAMRARCLNPKNWNYPYYGGRGIVICERWNDFANFLADMGERPAGATLDRIDANGGYEPGNVRWATQKEQSRNQSSNRLITYMGRTMPVSEAAEAAGLSAAMVRKRLNYGWSVDQALSKPSRLAKCRSPELRSA